MLKESSSKAAIFSEMRTRSPRPATRAFTAALLAAALLAFGGAAFAQSPNPITFKSEIYVVSQVTLSDGTKEERFTAATQAIPGQIVEYRIFATNSGETTLPAGVVQIYGPVQNGMEYVPNSATPSSDRVMTEFSTDGVNFSEPPVLVGPDSDRRVAEPTEYTMIRWTLLVPLEPGQEEPFYYRVVLK